MRMIFMGSTPFSAAILETVMESGLADVVGVWTQPPRPAGRGYHAQETPVAALAKQYGLPLFTPLSLKPADEQEQIRALNPTIGLVVAYGLIIPASVLEMAPMGFLNIHASLLPRWRGAAPIHRAILEGDLETGITLMQMDPGLDTGPMLDKVKVQITPGMTTPDLTQELLEAAKRQLLRCLVPFAGGQLIPTPQPMEGASYAHKIEKAETQLTWDQPADVLARKVWAFFPHAWANVKGERLKILDAAYGGMGEMSPQAGTVRDSKFTIWCKDGYLEPLVVQRAGGKPQSIQTFLNGFSCAVGERLG